jgi:hypothetical protein
MNAKDRSLADTALRLNTAAEQCHEAAAEVQAETHAIVGDATARLCEHLEDLANLVRADPATRVADFDQQILTLGTRPHGHLDAALCSEFEGVVDQIAGDGLQLARIRPQLDFWRL